MKFWFLSLTGLFILVSFAGCIDFYKVSYEIKLDTPDKGTAFVHLYDLRTDAANDKDLETDKKNIFQFALKSDAFLKSMMQEGKNIQSRQLSLSGDTLDADVVYTFDSITSVENMQHDAGFFYLTLEPTDSVLSTNGEIIKSKDRKRILWDKSMTTLKFEILSNKFTGKSYRMLGPFYKPE